MATPAPAASPKLVGSIDQGTSSTRFLIVNEASEVVSLDQKEHPQVYFNIEGKRDWVEHDPILIWNNTKAVIAGALAKANLKPSDLTCIGITNQRETTVIWNKNTGEPYYNAIVWNDVRASEAGFDIVGELAAESPLGTNRFHNATGLPLNSYFSALKVIWLMRNVKGLKAEMIHGNAIFGTIDTWLLWNLTGGVNGGEHATDVTNASRTMMMNIHSLTWDQAILDKLKIPNSILPTIKSSAEVYGKGAADGPLPGVAIAGILGDQQAALFGQTAFAPGDAKCTYGTGQFLLFNSGSKVIISDTVLTTVGYQIGKDAPCVYALEGSVNTCGQVIRWLRDNLKLFDNVEDSEKYAREVKDNGGMYFVPAFSGLFTPRWDSTARAAIVGMSASNNRGHLCRAAIESACFQAREIVDAMIEASGVPLKALHVDGGMTSNTLMLEFQADILNIPVLRPQVKEATAIGVAYAAGLACGVWKTQDELKKFAKIERTFTPSLDEVSRENYFLEWNRAVSKSQGWVQEKNCCL